MPNLTPGKNIGFKVGLQSTVNDIISGAAGAPIVVPGSFYLAEDTHRLYVGNDDLTLSPINEGIIFITNQSDLPTLTTSNITQYAGQLYYITSSNILCMAANTNDPTGNVPHWVQINPDTYLMSTSSAVSTSLANNVVTVTTQVQDTIGQLDNNNRLQPVHTASGQFKIQGGENVTFTRDQTTGTITISTPSGDIYHLDAAALEEGSDSGILENRDKYVKLVLSSNSHPDEIVYLTKGDQGNITPTMSSVTVGDITYPIIKLNGGGLVGTTIQLGMDANDKLTFTLVNGNDRVSTNITPTLTYGKAVDAGSNKVNKVDFNLTGSASTGYTLTGDLDVYTTGEVDALINQQLQGFDAMYFAGTIGSAADTFDNLEDLYNTATATAKIKSGATFKFTQTVGGTLPTGMTIVGWKTTEDDHGQTGAQVGDMLIVTGVEDTTTGYIDPKASTTKYTYIPAGDDADIYYTPNFGIGKTLSFTKSGTNGEIHQINFTEGTDVVVTGTVSDGSYGGKNQTINIAHSTITTTPTTASDLTNAGQSQDYTAVTGLTISNGHITGYETQKITLSHYRLSKAETKAVGGTETYVGSGKYSDVFFGTDYWTGASDGANTIQLNAGTNGYNNKMNLSSSTLQFSINSAGAASGTATAASVAIDMVWGSF